MSRGTLLQLNISPGGMPKLPIASARITFDGVPGDWQTDRKHHGGRNRAICVFSQELYDFFRAEYGIDMHFGAVGENFTTGGIDLNALKPGDQLRVGGCTIQITAVRVPCSNLKKWDARLPKLVEGRSGWVCKVIREGDVKPGDVIEHSSH